MWSNNSSKCLGRLFPEPFELFFNFITDHVRSTRESNVFSFVCLSVHKGCYRMIHWDRQEGGPPPPPTAVEIGDRGRYTLEC